MKQSYCQKCEALIFAVFYIFINYITPHIKRSNAKDAHLSQTPPMYVASIGFVKYHINIFIPSKSIIPTLNSLPSTRPPRKSRHSRPPSSTSKRPLLLITPRITISAHPPFLPPRLDIPATRTATSQT